MFQLAHITNENMLKNPSKISIMMSFKCSTHQKIAFDHSTVSFNVANTVAMCKIGIKYQYATRAVCAYAHIFRKWPACVLIKMNIVFTLLCILFNSVSDFLFILVDFRTGI